MTWYTELAPGYAAALDSARNAQGLRGVLVEPLRPGRRPGPPRRVLRASVIVGDDGRACPVVELAPSMHRATDEIPLADLLAGWRIIAEEAPDAVPI